MVELVGSKWQTRGYKVNAFDVQLNGRIVVQCNNDVRSLHFVPLNSLSDQKIQSGWENVTGKYFKS